MPLVDAAPLLVAQALRFAREEGLDLTLPPAPSWATLRDMLGSGQVVATQMLSPLPVAGALGLGAASRGLGVESWRCAMVLTPSPRLPPQGRCFAAICTACI